MFKVYSVGKSSFCTGIVCHTISLFIGQPMRRQFPNFMCCPNVWNSRDFRIWIALFIPLPLFPISGVAQPMVVGFMPPLPGLQPVMSILLLVANWTMRYENLSNVSTEIAFAGIENGTQTDWIMPTIDSRFDASDSEDEILSILLGPLQPEH